MGLLLLIFMSTAKYHGISFPIPFVKEIKNHIENRPEYRTIAEFIREAVREKIRAEVNLENEMMRRQRGDGLYNMLAQQKSPNLEDRMADIENKIEHILKILKD